MKYRPFGKLDFQVSALGFGCMRLPTIAGDAKAVDEELAIKMIRYALDHGVNYVDTAYPYHAGASERVLGKALKDGYRDKTRIATKLPTWAVKTAADFDRLLDEQLQRLDVDRIDFYLLHNLKSAVWPRLRGLGVLDWLDRIQADGRVSHVGFSFHDHYEVFEEIIRSYDHWALAQIQYNYVNESVQAGTKGLKFAASQGLAVVVMEPILGGCLANPPAAIRAILDSAPVKRSPAEWALQWVWNHPEVSVALSGMSTMEQVVENVESACRSGAGSLTPEELDLIARAQKAREELGVSPCTGCGYCLPCPHGVDIPFNMQLYNDALVFGGNQKVLNRNLYNGLAQEARAGACQACGECEDKCPQDIPIREWMAKIHEYFAKQ